jgi:hypothetical protein
LVTPGTSAIGERLAAGNPQELQGRQQQQECLPQSECKQQQSEATTVTSATSNIRETAISWPLTTAGTQATTGASTQAVWAQSKAGMLAKTVKPATAWREANCSRDIRNITASTAEGRPAIARMPERRLTNNSTSISRDANSIIWMPTSHEFSRKFAKKSPEGRKIR